MVYLHVLFKFICTCVKIQQNVNFLQDFNVTFDTCWRQRFFCLIKNKSKLFVGGLPQIIPAKFKTFGLIVSEILEIWQKTLEIIPIQEPFQRSKTSRNIGSLPINKFAWFLFISVHFHLNRFEKCEFQQGFNVNFYPFWWP